MRLRHHLDCAVPLMDLADEAPPPCVAGGPALAISCCGAPAWGDAASCAVSCLRLHGEVGSAAGLKWAVRLRCERQAARLGPLNKLRRRIATPYMAGRDAWLLVACAPPASVLQEQTTTHLLRAPLRALPA